MCACVHVCVSHVYRLLSLFFQTDRHLKRLLCDKLAFKTDFKNYLWFGGNLAVDVEFFSLTFIYLFNIMKTLRPFSTINIIIIKFVIYF